MTRIRVATGLLAVFLLIPQTGFTQEFSSHSSSEPAAVTEDREFRLRGFAETLEQAKALDKTYAGDRTAYFGKRANSRNACRDELRRSNKSSLVPTLLNCYRSELTSMKEFLGKQKEYLQKTSGLIPAVRTMAVTRTEQFADAAGTIIFAIDSGVYESKDDILEAKQNLYKKYETPSADAWITVRGDRTLTWIAFMIARLDQLIAQEHAVNLDRSGLTDSRTCLVTQETMLRSLLKPETTDRAQKLPSALREAQTCIGKIQGISRALNGSGAIITP